MLECKICKASISSTNYDKHYKRCQSVQRYVNSNTCIVCDLTFDNTQEVFRHVKQKHFGMSANEEEDSEIGLSIIDATGTNTKPWEIKPTNTLRNPNPARGIFANVDFDRLNKRPPNVAAKPSVSNGGASKSRPKTSTVVGM